MKHTDILSRHTEDLSQWRGKQQQLLDTGGKTEHTDKHF